MKFKLKTELLQAHRAFLWHTVPFLWVDAMRGVLLVNHFLKEIQPTIDLIFPIG